ncbi:MAG: Mitomycin biosynthesis 6-O-methyltransferase [Myxococcota bacterium]|nr:Mitomycin biosynthesis 6-O-methyltransferase [Myxococcota bacterium]
MELTGHPLPAPPPRWMVVLMMALRRKIIRALNAMTPAELVLFDMSAGVARTQVIGVLAALNIADRLDSGPATARELARLTGVNAGALHRLMRASAAWGVFDLDGEGRFHNNRLSRALKTGASTARAFAQYMASASNVHAWAAAAEPVNTGRSAFEHVHGMGIWEWFDLHPHERETFARAMMSLTIVDAPAIVSTYPFHEIGTLCDVGGGRGTLLSEVLLRNPGMKGVLCDAPGVLESAASLLAARGVQDRVTLRQGSFFDQVPLGADAWMLKNILHDWDDERCRKILRVIRAAMKPGQKLLVIESLLEPNGNDEISVVSDVQMLVVCSGGCERSREEYFALFRDCGFRPGRVLQTQLQMAVIEGVAV